MHVKNTRNADAVEVIEPEILTMNDAELLGVDNEEMQELLQRPAVFMTGSMYGQKDRRNTQDGDWKRVELPWLGWLVGEDKGLKSWGLTRHPVAKAKEGPSIVLADSIDGARTDAAIKTMYAVGLDIDSGAKLDDVLDRLEELGVFAVVYTSFSHGKDELVLKFDDVVRKLQLDGEPTLSDIQTYLREYHKDRYDESFIKTGEIVELRKRTKAGQRTILKTQPLDKFRVILPFWEPVELADLGTTQQQQKDVWADAVTGVAVNMLGVNFDATCCDVNRLFFTPRHPKDADEWYCAVVQGRPLRFDEIEPYSKDAYAKNRGDADPFADGAGDAPGAALEEILAPSGLNLRSWHRTHKERWLACDVMEAFCDDKIRVAGNEKAGTCHIECPFEHEHSSEGGTGTRCMNPDETDAGYWTIFCRHDACQGRDKLEFLAEMLAQNWFDEFVLTDDEWNIPLPDGEQVIELDSEDIDAAIESAGIGKGSKDKDIRKFVSDYLGADVTTQAGLFMGVSRVTLLTPSQVKKIYKELSEERAAEVIIEDAKKREKKKTPDYIALADATQDTVTKAAAAAKWLPGRWTHQDGWFGRLLSDDTGGTKFAPVAREFEVVYFADGEKGSTRENQVTIRYLHRSRGLGIVESTFRIGDTYKDAGSILGRLRNEGLDFHAQADTGDILTLLRSVQSDREAVYCAQSGWTADKDAFVSPTGEVVARAGDKRLFVLDQIMKVSNEKAGSLDIAIAAADDALRGRNSKLFLPGFMTGAVGCLADFLDTELAVILANEGKAKHGKSTALKAGVSLFAIPTAKGLLLSGDVTPTAMESMAAKAKGAAFAPDEQGTSGQSAEEEQQAMLQYAGKIGRARGTPTGGLRDFNMWNGCMGISTEHGLLSRLEGEEAHIRSGALSRVFTVNYDQAVTLDRDADAAELAAYKVLAHGGAYGWLGPQFAKVLLEMGVDVVGARVSVLESEWGAEYSGAAERVVSTGALFGVAVEIAQEAQLLPADLDLKGWIKDLTDQTIAQRERHLNTETQVLDALRLRIIRAVNGHQIVHAGTGSEDARGEILGYWNGGTVTGRTDDDDDYSDLCERTYILPVDRLGKLGISSDVAALVEQLRRVGALVLPSDGSKYFKRGMWETTPNEGRGVLSVRVSGRWVHGGD